MRISRKDLAVSEADEKKALLLYGHLPKTRQEAIDRRSDKYFTRRPCVNGHLSPRYTKWGTCIACAMESSARRSDEAKRALEGCGVTNEYA